MVMKGSIFCDVTPCTSLKITRRFGGTCVSVEGQDKQKPNMKYAASRTWLDPEDGGDMFFRNVG
jgi:hypothetical protein